jgi:glutamate synthase domain-containing protein 2/glutamate synthase domain-containing protein 1/glutamate synthase domain-containing protein 3
MNTLRPQAAGLYDPTFEHDACGVGAVACLSGERRHTTVERALHVLDHLEHRGASGAEADTGDGAGILLQIPDAFLREEVDFELPPEGRYAVGVCFLPQDEARRREIEQTIEQTVADHGQTLLGWRDVPVDGDVPGASAAAVQPAIRQVFVGSTLPEDADELDFERKIYVIRRIVERAISIDELAIPSFSARTIVYKGMLTSPQLPAYFPELRDERMVSALALVHSRFSTNTFPSWELAHPYRMIAHNGEINTLRGNVNWMRARESQLLSDVFGDDLEHVSPVVRPGGSDSATFDNVLELLVLSGRSLPHALMMMIPEAWEDRDDMPAHVQDFYAFHSCLMEPWDGPAAVAFTDGKVLGATLDRNGLRPGRWQLTNDGFVVLASETGVLEYDPADVVQKGRLQPGKIFMVDVENGRIVEDGELKAEISKQQPYGDWYRQHVVHLDGMDDVAPRDMPAEDVHTRQLLFGYSQEDLRITLARMGGSAEEPIGSMGNDFALAVLSDRGPLLYSYFKQLFAQVTNPPIDPIREKIVMSLSTAVGRQSNLLGETPEHAHQLVISQPLLSNGELEKLRQVDHHVFQSDTLDATWPVAEGVDGLGAAMERICREASECLAKGDNILILSDRAAGKDRVPIPALLAVAGVHHHLVREGTRLQAGLVVESGEPREPHHIACLIGYGASAVNPYLAFETLHQMFDRALLPGVENAAEAERNMVKGMGKAILKTISKMGISTVRSYCGAQIFEAVGLEPELIEKYFTGTTSRIGGIGLEVLAQEALTRHARAFPYSQGRLPVGGVHAWRRDGEHHQWNPDTIALLQHSVRAGGAKTFEEYSKLVNDDSSRKATLRGLLKVREPEGAAIPIDEVESAKDIVKRFATGAMSLGSLSTEAHETLAIAMNRLGGKSNTGEGGEDARRFTRDANGDLRRSAIKQVASGRFGVTAHYLINADELQIKMAQGAKPGEGGQLPGHKVDDYIAKIRHSTPGVGLISPPPHHDIYSIEDLKQLIFDLRCSNPGARISVKLVSEVGVGTVAAGVAKANSDHVVIAGHDGGTGASPVSSIQAAGVPWEIGLAETQQTLVKNKLRDRITVQTDGQLKTGRDVMVAALLGAEEFGFSTAPLITTGCIMMRACHLNTCPVGIATQDPELRKRFRGKPEHVVNFFFFVAEEVRGYMAQLGIRKFEDLIGRTDLLETDGAIDHWKAKGVDLTHLLAAPDAPPEVPRRKVRPQDPVLDDHRDHELIEKARAAIENGDVVEIDDIRVQNQHRCVGGILSSEIAKRHGAEGLPDDTIVIRAHGHGGQSFGGWLMKGITLLLEGDANDYTGKGMSGGVLAVRPPENVTFVPEQNVVIGNTVLYGATAGRAFFRGLAGERFAVRNSGVEAVVEGVGDHGCEYMTGGTVVVLGPTGRNFAAGMSGGVAYVLDEKNEFHARCNQEIVDLEDPSGDDFEDVRALVQEHRDLTGSTVAERVLRDWDSLRGAWIKVMPLDYKRALRELAEREAEDAGEPALVAERSNGDGSGPADVDGDAPYQPAGGHEEARGTGEAGQYQDAARAADGANGNEQAEGEAGERVLPSHG